jgi:cell division septal protein FtsQ
MWPGFRLGALEIAGNAIVSREAIVARAAFERERSVWLLDTHAVERRIERIPYISVARVHRSFPNAVTITVAEREPAGCLIVSGDDELTIDPLQRVLDQDCERKPQPTFRLPELAAPAPGSFVDSKALARLLADAAILQRERDPFVAFAYDRFGGLEATLASGLLVRFGSEADLPQKFVQFVAILADVGSPRALRSVDLRAPATPVVESREPQHIQDSTPAHHNI